jgi:anaerobic ribonucleoside-triphosphate reductase activating protein
MIKYKPDTPQIVFNEVPDMISLAIEITNCPGHCIGCHSPWLREDIGDELTEEKLFELIEANKGINCVVFMGEGKDPETLKKLAKSIHYRYPNVKTALYSGRDEIEEDFYSYFNFVKLGPYIEEFGPLNKETTNQHLYEIEINPIDKTTTRKDITYKFWRKY